MPSTFDKRGFNFFSVCTNDAVKVSTFLSEPFKAGDADAKLVLIKAVVCSRFLSIVLNDS